MAGRGYNLVHGYDTGPAPPGFQPGITAPQGFPALPPWGMGISQPYQVPLPAPVPIAPAFPAPYGMGMYPGGMGMYPGFRPPPDGGFPGIHLRNHTGGVGLPPGYDYIFPLEHCKIHVFKTKEKPWQLTLWKEDLSTHVKLFVPTTTTVKELMQNLGCTNPEPAKNILYEICEKGNGRWASGIKIKGDEKDKVKKSIKEYGWDVSRTGNPGEKGVVWLWVSKDGA